MTRARKELIAVESTPYYHCMVRCVRRAYLCGEDRVTGRNYDHRKQWTVERLRQLASVFAIDVCAYAVMSNHYHVVLHIDHEKAQVWSEKEVARRWTQIFNGPECVQSWLEGHSLEDGEKAQLDVQLLKWRERLADISWFMRCMNETIARQANKEDGCRGRFWEGRFKSQALLDEKALLACMAYVDLNPIRAELADKPETSDFTSIQVRLSEHLEGLKKPTKKAKLAAKQLKRRFQKQQACYDKKLDHNEDLSIAPMMELRGVDKNLSESNYIPFSVADYIDLVEQTGKVIREDKKGFIGGKQPDILDRLGIPAEHWVTCVKRYGSMFSVVAGGKGRLQCYLESTDKKWVKGVSSGL